MVGRLDEIANYDKALSVAEAQWIYNSGVARALTDPGCPSNLVGWWRMGEGDTYPTLQDQTVNNYDGTMTNMEAGDILTDYPSGVDGSLYELGSFASEECGGVLDGHLYSMGDTPVVISYKMRAQDDGVPPPGYVTWISANNPDFAGVGFPGGVPTPVGGMVGGSATVVTRWEE
jgi:hypothetical protein